MRTVMLVAVLALAATGCRGADAPREASPATPAPATAQPAGPQATPPQQVTPSSSPAAPAPTESLQPAGTPAAETPSTEASPAAAPRAQTSPSASPMQVQAGAPPAPQAPASPAPPVPRYREITIPEGTELALTLETTVASNTSRVEDPVRASLRRSIVVDDARVVPSGTEVLGSVVDVARSAKVQGRARLSLRFTELRLDEERLDLRTSSYTRQARSTKKKDTAKIGVPAVGGAILGALIGGGKGAAVGATIGGGAGTAAVLSTRGEEVRLPSGTPVTVRLTAPLTVRIRVE